MKHILYSLFLFVSMTAEAQTWEKKTEAADIVKETPERIYYILNVDSVTSVKVYADNDEWYLSTKFHRNGFKINIKMFQTQLMEIQTSATFGFLGPDGNITQPTLKNIKMTATQRAQVIGSGKYTSNDAAKVSNYLKVNEGWVQIIAPLHMGGELNMKIPCIPDNVK